MIKLLLSLLIAFASASTNANAIVSISDIKFIAATKSSGQHIEFTLIPANSSMKVDAKLKHGIRQSTDFFFVGQHAFFDSTGFYALMIVQTPSKKSLGQGFCGAGTEDYLYLLELNIDQLKVLIRDSLILQSCLKNISLNEDEGQSIRQRFKSIDASNGLSVKWLISPKGENREQLIIVKEGRLVVK